MVHSCQLFDAIVFCLSDNMTLSRCGSSAPDWTLAKVSSLEKESNDSSLLSEPRSCVKVEVAVLGSRP